MSAGNKMGERFSKGSRESQADIFRFIKSEMGDPHFAANVEKEFKWDLAVTKNEEPI